MDDLPCGHVIRVIQHKGAVLFFGRGAVWSSDESHRHVDQVEIHVVQLQTIQLLGQEIRDIRGAITDMGQLKRPQPQINNLKIRKN